MTKQQPIRVMLVDDHPTVLWGLEKLIDSAAPDMELVGKASCRAEALAQFQASRPEVVLVDLDLGEESGLDLLAELQALGDAKLIVLTGCRDPKLHRQAVLGGACGLVLKSERAEVILQAIIQVHTGQLWLGRATMATMLASLSDAEGEPSRATETDGLTAAERKIVAAVVRQKSVPNKVIADALHISSHTLRNHLASIYSKLDIHRRLDLVLYAMEQGLSERDPEASAATVPASRSRLSLAHEALRR